ncbi:MAG: hypothetical protein IPO87_06380 [Flavobacteriales bacterium]|nr:hypothetical protein [Flavobacteriales bacterium]
MISGPNGIEVERKNNETPELEMKKHGIPITLLLLASGSCLGQGASPRCSPLLVEKAGSPTSKMSLDHR